MTALGLFVRHMLVQGPESHRIVHGRPIPHREGVASSDTTEDCKRACSLSQLRFCLICQIFLRFAHLGPDLPLFSIADIQSATDALCMAKLVHCVHTAWALRAMLTQ